MGSHESKSQADWMKQLPEDLRNYPLHKLAIPGTHDSGTFDLSCFKGIAPDSQLGRSSNCLVRTVLNSCCVSFLATKPWSQTQNLSFRRQLEAGVRFFDMRVGKRPLDAATTREAGNKVADYRVDDANADNEKRDSHLRSRIEDRLLCVHGLYGPTVRACVNDVRAFLDQHTGEVVLLDFNRFHGLDTSDHVVLAEMLDEVFGDLICRYPGQLGEALTLNQLCQAGTRVIVFYYEWGHPGKGRPERCLHFWPFSAIDSQSSWVNTSSVEEWVKRQRDFRRERRDYYQSQGDPLAPFSTTGDRDGTELQLLDRRDHEEWEITGRPARFYVCQGVLTPDEGGAMIKKNLCCTIFSCGQKGTLKTECSARINPVLLDWMEEEGEEEEEESAAGSYGSKRRFVIYSADFVSDVFKDKAGTLVSFVERVIELNNKLIH